MFQKSTTETFVGLTPLHIAVANGYDEIVSVLLRSGADVHQTYSRIVDKADPYRTAIDFKSTTLDALIRSGTEQLPRDGASGRNASPRFARAGDKVEEYVIPVGLILWVVLCLFKSKRVKCMGVVF